MAQASRVTVVDDGLELGGRRVPLLSGEIHYFRHDPSDWPRLLDAAVGLGLTVVSTYVPWGTHEVEPDHYDFGEKKKSRALLRFLDLAGERGLLVALRPGPHVNAELTWLGYPFRVLRDPRVMARTPEGNPVWLPVPPRALPVPSYASRVFLEASARWLDTVARRVSDRQWPDGPVALVQLDNEVPLLFRDGPFDQDYSEDAVEAWRVFRAAEGLAAGVEPPRAFAATTVAELQPTLDWVRFKVGVYAKALARLRAALEGAGLTRVAFTHNVTQGGAVPPLWPGELGAADAVGFDFYHQRRLLRAARGRCLYAAGTCRLPFAAELGTGGPWNLPPLRGADTDALARTALGCGLRGLNLFMVADRDRWYGAPIDAKGRLVEPRAGRTKALLAAARSLIEGGARLGARVAVVVPRAYVRLSQATWGGGPLLPPSIEAFGLGPSFGCREDRLGLAEPVQVAWSEALDRIIEALGRRGLGHVLVDGEAVPGRLEGIEVAIVPTFELFDRALWDRLLARAREGLELVVGPRIPGLSERGEPFDPGVELEVGGETAFGQGRVALHDPRTADGAAALADRLARREGLLAPVRSDEVGVEVTVLEAKAGPTVACVAELCGRSRAEVRLSLPEGTRALVDLLDGRRTPAGGGVARLRLAPHEVRLLGLEAG